MTLGINMQMYKWSFFFVTSLLLGPPNVRCDTDVMATWHHTEAVTLEWIAEKEGEIGTVNLFKWEITNNVVRSF